MLANLPRSKPTPPRAATWTSFLEPDAPGAALHALVREHERALQSFALRLCGVRADAQDLVQDTHERALRSMHTFAPGTNGRAWLFTILHRAFIDRCRRRAVERRSSRIEDVAAATESSERPAWASVSPEQLARAIDALEDEFRTVYRMHALQSLSYKEIAARLGLPVSTVGTRLNRARSKLRAMLEAAVDEEPAPLRETRAH